MIYEDNQENQGEQTILKPHFYPYYFEVLTIMFEPNMNIFQLK